MSFYQLVQTQKIPASLDTVWSFISSPLNLKEITPDYLAFAVTGNNPESNMYPGMIITYTLSPVFGIKLNWMTEITHVKDKEYFVDEQRVGPYKLWHHQHKLEPTEGGVVMTDIVTYQPPFGFIGNLANRFILTHKLKEIFDYRSSAVEKRFGKFIHDNKKQDLHV